VLDARVRHDEQQRALARLQGDLETANAALRTKLTELEQLNAALIDREERMIELKAELAQLRGPRKLD